MNAPQKQVFSGSLLHGKVKIFPVRVYRIGVMFLWQLPSLLWKFSTSCWFRIHFLPGRNRSGSTVMKQELRADVKRCRGHFCATIWSWGKTPPPGGARWQSRAPHLGGVRYPRTSHQTLQVTQTFFIPAWEQMHRFSSAEFFFTPVLQDAIFPPMGNTASASK